MNLQVLDGKKLATKLQTALQQQIIQHALQRPPCLAVIQLGNDPASTIYVNNKKIACHSVGITTVMKLLPATISQSALCDIIGQLNQDTTIDGILVQLPIPNHLSLRTVIEHIDPSKDVDGLHPYNLGRLAQGEPMFRPCTPYGIMQLLEHYKYDITSKHAVIIGTSSHVGKPMALELLNSKATVTQCHSKTLNLQKHVTAADLLIIATGQQDVIPTSWLKSHHVVVDVGIHRLAKGIIRGDIDYNAAIQIVSMISPVPGGVGPMTIMALLQNVLQAKLKPSKDI